MENEDKTAYVLAANKAPDEFKRLKESAFCAIMELTKSEQINVLSKYAERYGVGL